MLVHHRVIHGTKFTGAHSSVERDAVTIKRLAQEHYAICPLPGLIPGPEMSVLATVPATYRGSKQVHFLNPLISVYKLKSPSYKL